MSLTNLIAEIQANPRNIVAYRRLAEYYHGQGMENEYEAIRELIRQEFSHSASSNQEQLPDDQKGNPLDSPPGGEDSSG
jgi:hypothetical protein